MVKLVFLASKFPVMFKDDFGSVKANYIYVNPKRVDTNNMLESKTEIPETAIMDIKPNGPVEPSSNFNAAEVDEAGMSTSFSTTTETTTTHSPIEPITQTNESAQTKDFLLTKCIIFLCFSFRYLL